ncbi:MAG: HIT domain-containing protein [Candidatus Nealsonbacteria bacterium]
MNILRGNSGEESVDRTYIDTDLKYKELIDEMKGCPFCPPNFPGKNVVLYEFGGWQIMERLKELVPYQNVDTHLIMLPKKHIRNLEGIGSADWYAVKKLIVFAKEKFLIFDTGGGLAIRFGSNSGVTIYHVHFHLIAPITNPETGKVYPGKHVDFPIG